MIRQLYFVDRAINYIKKHLRRNVSAVSSQILFVVVLSRIEFVNVISINDCTKSAMHYPSVPLPLKPFVINEIRLTCDNKSVSPKDFFMTNISRVSFPLAPGLM